MRTLDDLFERGLSRPSPRHARWRDAEGRWNALSTEQVREHVAAAAAGLASLGARHGDRVALISRNNERWALADFACVSRGLVDVPLYPTLSPPQAAFILNDSGSRILLVEDDAQLERLREAIAETPVEHVIVLRDESGVPEGALGWSELLERGRGAPREGADVSPDDLATIIYTSGTTGDPKGVMLTHDNLVSNAAACAEAIDLTHVPRHVNLSLLPLCHVFQRLVDYFLWAGHAEMVYCPSPLEALDYFREVRPTFFASVPRLYEKVRAGFLGKVAEAPPARRRLAEWALDAGRRHFRAWYRDGACDGTPGLVLRLEHALADALVLKKVRAVFGGRVDLCFSGGAALPPEVHEFLRAVGMNVLPGYGLTETSPVVATNRRDRMKLGTVGPPLPGVDVRTAPDGELLVRGRNVMKGYWNRPETTAECLDGEWLRTGDLARIDEHGCVAITGRKKEILVLSTGKNVSPSVVEGELARSPLVAQVVVVGDDRKHVAALVRPNVEALQQAAAQRGVRARGAELLRDPVAERLVLESILEAGKSLSPHELPKTIALLPRDLSQEEGELTPTLKVVRRQVGTNWRDLVETLYRGARPEAPRPGAEEAAS